jgi:hypothetical protein
MPPNAEPPRIARAPAPIGRPDRSRPKTASPAATSVPTTGTRLTCSSRIVLPASSIAGRRSFVRPFAVQDLEVLPGCRDVGEVAIPQPLGHPPAGPVPLCQLDARGEAAGRAERPADEHLCQLVVETAPAVLVRDPAGVADLVEPVMDPLGDRPGAGQVRRRACRQLAGV